jgi:hypothetical protein
LADGTVPTFFWKYSSVTGVFWICLAVTVNTLSTMQLILNHLAAEVLMGKPVDAVPVTADGGFHSFQVVEDMRHSKANKVSSTVLTCKARSLFKPV